MKLFIFVCLSLLGAFASGENQLRASDDRILTNLKDAGEACHKDHECHGKKCAYMIVQKGGHHRFLHGGHHHNHHHHGGHHHHHRHQHHAKPDEPKQPKYAKKQVCCPKGASQHRIMDGHHYYSWCVHLPKGAMCKYDKQCGGHLVCKDYKCGHGH